MSREKLIAALNEMGDLTSSEIEAVAKSRNAELERRIAAILFIAAVESPSVGGSATDLILDLTDPRPAE